MCNSVVPAPKPFFKFENIVDFWNKNEHKIKSFYLKQKRNDDIIISASCGFILGEIFRRLGITRYMCSEIDLKSGEILSLCYHSNKPEIFKKNYLLCGPNKIFGNCPFISERRR